MAAPAYSDVQFDPANNEGSVIVAIGESTTATVNLEANRLLDELEMIKLEYGAELQGLQIKEVIAPEGITITLSDQSLVNLSEMDEVALEFTVTADRSFVGSVPVRVVMENPLTGEITNVDLTVQTQ
ncbi:MAG: hypothetical protein HC933_07530 [Pleurocapsa sp. SU_196_0]|nr:hypothetical protein [Pleurocapsa sp. SU_196_0]